MAVLENDYTSIPISRCDGRSLPQSSYGEISMITLLVSVWNFILKARERQVEEMIRTGRIPRYF
jgi:hypothetical protein